MIVNGWRLKNSSSSWAAAFEPATRWNAKAVPATAAIPDRNMSSCLACGCVKGRRQRSIAAQVGRQFDLDELLRVRVAVDGRDRYRAAQSRQLCSQHCSSDPWRQALGEKHGHRDHAVPRPAAGSERRVELGTNAG